jgi:hypothetical protein
MTQTDVDMKVVEPNLIYRVNTGITNLPFDVEAELEKFSRIYITKEFDPFRLVNCFEAATRDYEIYGETKDGDKKLLFTSVIHFECCNCCEQYIIGDFCCAYACCDSIIFQMDYRRNGFPFYTQGSNIKKGCHCCDIMFLNCLRDYCACPQSTLFLRQNIDPDSPDPDVGIKKGKTDTNCCCSCDKYVNYTQENNLRGLTVRAACCDLCRNSCFVACCSYCSYCIQGFDLEMSIENDIGVKTGNVRVYAGCCSEKTKGKCCYFPRPYFEVNMPPQATSGQKFQVIADIIHLDLANKII